MSGIIAEYNTAQRAFKQTLSDISQVMPKPCINELQYMLNHMMKALSGVDDVEREECFSKALGHLRRAHLDYLKVAIFIIYSQMLTEKENEFPDFLRGLLQARLLEFKYLGSPRDAAIKVYYETIVKFRLDRSLSTLFHPEAAQINYVEGKQEGRLNFSLHRDGDSANLKLLFSLYMEWARLELLLVAIANTRYHDLTLAVIQSFFDSTLCNDLPYIIAQTKAKIVDVFLETPQQRLKSFQIGAEYSSGIQMDIDVCKRYTEIKQKVFHGERHDDKGLARFVEACEEVKLSKKESSNNRPSEDAKNRLIRDVEQPFTSLLAYLGVNLSEHPIEFLS